MISTTRNIQILLILELLSSHQAFCIQNDHNNNTLLMPLLTQTTEKNICT